MNAGLLREYVTLMVEKIRTKKGQKGIMGTKFELSKFKQLDDQRAILAYASKFLEKLGQGSSRYAFLLSGKYALKIAINEKGLAQNDAELDVFTNPKSKPIVAKVYSVDNDNRWIISDLVKPLNDEREFGQLTGTDWRDFVETINDHLRHDGTRSIDADEFTTVVIKNANVNKLKVGDIEELGHWGKTPDGRAVLLDYGFTEDVWNDHYRDSQMPKAKSAASGDKTAAPGKANDTDKVDVLGKTGLGIGPGASGKSRVSGTGKTHAVPTPSDAKTTAPKKAVGAVSPDEDPEKTRR